MNKNTAMSITIVVMLALPILASLYANSLRPVLSAPMIRAPGRASCPPNCVSYNWSGYAVTGATGSVSDVKGSWKVPAVVGALCASTSWYASSFWVGIDGFSSSTVEQIGTESDCFEGTLQYYAWYEFYPAGSVVISALTIHPADVISAEVSYSASKFTASIKDVTTGKSFSITTKVSGAKRSSGEWIAESPFSVIGELPLADFGTAYYGFDNTGITGTCYATVSSVAGTIKSFGPKVASITAVDYPAGSPNKAVPSALSTDGTSFNVIWVSSGPYG